MTGTESDLDWEAIASDYIFHANVIEYVFSLLIVSKLASSQ